MKAKESHSLGQENLQIIILLFLNIKSTVVTPYSVKHMCTTLLSHHTV